MADRDVEKGYSAAEFAAKLRRLADALESGASFRIQVAGERFRVPRNAEISVEHEREGDDEELELQLKWKVADLDDEADDEPEV
jgi:amphi-Trp domain-containing protein